MPGQELFRSQPDTIPTFRGSNPLQSGLDLVGNIISGTLSRASELADPVLDFEFAKKRLSLLDDKQVADSTGATKAVEITQPTGIVPGTVNVPRTALIVGGVLVAGIVAIVITKK